MAEKLMAPSKVALRLVPPGPQYLLAYADPTAFVRDRLHVLQYLARRYGNCCRFRLGFREAYLLNHPDAIRRLLVSEQRKVRRSAITQLTRFVLGNSVFNAGGVAHQQQRQRLGAALQGNRVESYFEIMLNEAKKLQKDWRAGDQIDLSRMTRRLALAIGSQAFFQLDLSYAADRIDEALKALFPAINRFDHPLQWLTWLAPIPANLRILRAIFTLKSIVKKTIAKASTLPRAESGLLGILLEARDRGDINDHLVRDEVMLMMVAGHETTSQALTWTLAMISTYPEVEERVNAEIDSVLGRRDMEWPALAALPYTRMVIKEALRLYPPSPIIDRYTCAEIDCGNYRIPAGRTVFVSPYVTHRDERFFTDPEKFDPSRWEDNKGVLEPSAYFPFGLGSRRCMGEPFAVAEMTIAIATFCQVWRFRRVMDSPITPQALVTLRPATEIRLQVTRR
jgi:cytochrome P450